VLVIFFSVFLMLLLDPYYAFVPRFVFQRCFFKLKVFEFSISEQGEIDLCMEFSFANPVTHRRDYFLFLFLLKTYLFHFFSRTGNEKPSESGPQSPKPKTLRSKQNSSGTETELKRKKGSLVLMEEKKFTGKLSRQFSGNATGSL
jgi:hypothetical protein